MSSQHNKSIFDGLLANQTHFYEEYAKKLEEQKAREKAEEEALTDEDRVFNKLKYPPKKKTLHDHILMPLIRRIVPVTIAQDIVGVQPMTGFTIPGKNGPDKEEEE